MSGEPRGRVAVIGTGKVGTAMAALLSDRGYEVTAVYDESGQAAAEAARLSGARTASSPADAVRGADIVIITTPDSSIREACARVSSADLASTKVLHMSGALSLEALEDASSAGADVLCVHPVQTFADLAGARRSLPGSAFGVTCAPRLEEWARGFVDSLGGRAVMVRDEDKALYHAACAIACNLLTMVQHAACFVNRRLGMTDEQTAAALGPLAAATLDNIARLGCAGALTGPLARGDAPTVEAHLEALERIDPALSEMYRAVSRWGIEVAREAGSLSEESLERMRDLLEK